MHKYSINVTNGLVIQTDSVLADCKGHIIQTRESAGHCSMVGFKEECPPHGFDWPL